MQGVTALLPIANDWPLAQRLEAAERRLFLSKRVIPTRRTSAWGQLRATRCAWRFGRAVKNSAV